ncbi:hypothetical protein TCAL_08953 [Tigriopus californicus]|uniref:Lysophospholipid acyltransferase 5 n=1 Tax=Tigriopus californicus TaxID=6832 RepID=A0A553PR29_TIGCA|nr:lysophospholipid acyltransferase 5-like [Tigriopus californicus]TRY80134.1 hypothetical protein TCAL_08953 [Tigriopus californicus]|eukprot:TCALIF_08953-PA protein Name:"Similar to LPCAT3 Lysophospholipid acyltransferase 5 (Bos taurus)" AED:0.08 eAED:0.08 QI:420/1/1/1/1/1/9/708/460
MSAFLVEALASKTGTPESGLRLILGQLAGYPIFLIHRNYFKKSSEWTQHLFFLTTGMFMSWWAIGEEALMHSCICVIATYLILRSLGGNFTAAMICFILNLSYLFIGYICNASRDYDITWTMPQCVICLRLIGLAMDVYDGTKKEEELSRDQKAGRLTEVPSLVECLSHSFFIGGYFVGPQFSMRKFKNYIEVNRTQDLPSPVAFGFKRLAIGWVYMIGHLIGSTFVPEAWVQTENFGQMNFLARTFWFSLWAKIILSKYIAAWLFAEGSCIISGIAYNGVDEATGEVKWNGMANVKLRVYEGAHKFQHLIDSFNINTNGWAASYIYKRLRFLNNKLYSQLGTLLFLAVWHGYHSGYFLTFANELLVMQVEKEFVAVWTKSPKAQALHEHPLGNIFCKVVGYLYVVTLLPHCFLPFPLLKFDKYWGPLWETRFIMYIIFGSWFLVRQPVKSFLLPPKKQD